MARGNFQTDDFDYAELYAPVPCIEAVRVLLAIAVSKDWSTDHLDIKGAFLYFLLPESDEAWLKLPTITRVSEASGSVVKFRKSLYGLRQSLKIWYKLLAKCLKRLGLRRSMTNESLFIGTSGPPVYLLVYVDVIMVFGNSTAVKDVKERLSSLFSTTDLGT